MRKTVYVVLRNGIIEDAFSDDENTDLVVFDLDVQDPEIKDELEKEVEKIKSKCEEVEILWKRQENQMSYV